VAANVSPNEPGRGYQPGHGHERDHGYQPGRAHEPGHGYDVTAAFPAMAQARKAIDALGLAGVEAQRITLYGRPVAEAASDAVTLDRDERIARHVGKRAVLFGAIGAVLGAAVGLVVGILAFSGAAGLYASIIGFGLAFGAIAGVYGAYASVSMTPAWELTYERVSGDVLVGVHSESEEDAERAAGVLRSHSPLRVEGPGAA
jgi:hypothetical protein